MIREQVQYNLYNVFLDNKFPKSLAWKTCKIIEISCNNTTVQFAIDANISTYWDEPRFQELYGNLVYKVFSSIDPNSGIYTDRNTTERMWLINKIKITAFVNFYNFKNLEMQRSLQKIFPLEFLKNIASYEIETLNPLLNYSIYQNLKIRAEQKVKKKTTSMFKCPQCKQRECTYEKKQIRSGDEGMTMFFDCCICGYHWSQNT